MINKKDFILMEKEVKIFDEDREILIKKTRDVIKLSKILIFSCHRNNCDTQAVKDITKEIDELNKIVEKNPKLYMQGSYKVAIQEYVEAMLYYYYIQNKKIYTRKELNVETDYYLLGLCDLSGELVRKAIREATNENYKEVIIIKDVLNEIYETLLSFDFRGGEIRSKFDSLKYDLKKIEDLVLELKLKNKI